MRISIFGLGYVGCVGMGCLAENGHQVIGVDIQPEKVALINQGQATIIEKDIDEIIKSQYQLGNLRATCDAEQAVPDSDVSMICVGTPSSEQGHLDMEHIYQTAEQIGQAMREKNGFHVVAIRSTVIPGTNEKVGRIIEKHSKKKRNRDFAIVSNPEFMREGSAVHDYFHPPLTVLGSESEEGLQTMEKVYEKIHAPLEKVDIKVAEMIKYVSNSFHALKVTFANEVGNICKQLGIDSHQVMRIFCMDRQLNISPYYLTPGFAYGGSCLPKDLKALTTLAHDHYLDTPVLNSIQPSNRKQTERAFHLIEKTGKKRIGIIGLSFKAGTDDLRNSPIIDVIEKLKGRGFAVKIFDANVSLSRLVGKNKSFIEEKLPHISSLMGKSLDMIIQWAEVIVLNNPNVEDLSAKISKDQFIVDLIRRTELEDRENYEGICW